MVTYRKRRQYLETVCEFVSANTDMPSVFFRFGILGRCRNPADWSYVLTSQPELFADRGFTGTEYPKYFNFVYMLSEAKSRWRSGSGNGRMYDPLVGRFLSADNVIQDPTSTRAYNRYTYCLNNPLKYTDPSGNTYKAYMDYYYGEENYWSRGEAPRRGGGGGGSGGGAGGTRQLPGYGNNGTGLNGTYYDWSSGTYRSTSSGHSEVGFSSVNFGVGDAQYTYTGLGFFFHDGNGNPITINGISADNRYYVGVTYNSNATSNSSGWNNTATPLDNISNGAGVASMYPTIRGTWAYNTFGGDVAWTGKNGNYYKLSQVRNNGGYVKSMNYANTTSRITKGIGNGLTIISMVTGGVSTGIAVANGADNTSTWVNLSIGVGTGVLTIFAAPAVVTGAAIVGGIWGISQLIGGDEINGFIDRNVGYEGGILNQIGY